MSNSIEETRGTRINCASQFQDPFTLSRAIHLDDGMKRARACWTVNRKKFFARLDPVDSRIHGATNQTEHLVHGANLSGSRSGFLTAYPYPWLCPPPSSPPSSHLGHPRSPPRHSFPFYSWPPRKIPEIFFGSSETTDSEKSPSTSIARRDVECVNTRVENAGTRCTFRKINRVAEAHPPKFPISILPFLPLFNLRAFFLLFPPLSLFLHFLNL